MSLGESNQTAAAFLEVTEDDLFDPDFLSSFSYTINFNRSNEIERISTHRFASDLTSDEVKKILGKPDHEENISFLIRLHYKVSNNTLLIDFNKSNGGKLFMISVSNN